MKTVGIIVEYNPMHNGHIYHINKVREQSKCDTLIAVMSGNFTQRGEPAIYDKFARTKVALQEGIDLVVELPFVFTVQNADIFALTSVSILDALGVDEIYFGSESNNIAELQEIGDILSRDDYNQLVKEYLGQGDSYPTASNKAMTTLYPNTAFAQPNNILGIQYILAGQQLNSSITFQTIKRIATGYHDDIVDGTNIQSASGIRKHIHDNEDVRDFVPTSMDKIITARHPVSYNDFTQALQGILYRMTPEELYQINHVEEGLEHRIININQFDDVDDLIDKIISRRYTNAKIKRMLACILTNVKTTDITDFTVPYIRVLGMNDTGRNHLNNIKHNLPVPLYTTIKEDLHPYIDIELRASKVYSLASDKDIYALEFKPVIY